MPAPTDPTLAEAGGAPPPPAISPENSAALPEITGAPTTGPSPAASPAAPSAAAEPPSQQTQAPWQVPLQLANTVAGGPPTLDLSVDLFDVSDRPHLGAGRAGALVQQFFFFPAGMPIGQCKECADRAGKQGWLMHPHIVRTHTPGTGLVGPSPEGLAVRRGAVLPALSRISMYAVCVGQSWPEDMPPIAVSVKDDSRMYAWAHSVQLEIAHFATLFLGSQVNRDAAPRMVEQLTAFLDAWNRGITAGDPANSDLRERYSGRPPVLLCTAHYQRQTKIVADAARVMGPQSFMSMLVGAEEPILNVAELADFEYDVAVLCYGGIGTDSPVFAPLGERQTEARRAADLIQHELNLRNAMAVNTSFIRPPPDKDR